MLCTLSYNICDGITTWREQNRELTTAAVNMWSRRAAGVRSCTGSDTTALAPYLLSLYGIPSPRGRHSMGDSKSEHCDNLSQARPSWAFVSGLEWRRCDKWPVSVTVELRAHEADGDHHKLAQHCSPALPRSRNTGVSSALAKHTV